MTDDIEAAVQDAMAAVSEYRQAGTFRSQAPDNTPVEQAIRHVADVARRDEAEWWLTTIDLSDLPNHADAPDDEVVSVTRPMGLWRQLRKRMAEAEEAVRRDA